ncbi:DUF7305 domain-containing protein [Cerasicoccus fimbriatus]|uniref:DUF7305 domain-containing protein n=1 Tax=Cerasicoccus fimbriatus TaxID=3014554 RepID=UPI0022B57D9D|nr:hypothetical protein [Cerasicoccus sp. TK19100]
MKSTKLSRILSVFILAGLVSVSIPYVEAKNDKSNGNGNGNSGGNGNGNGSGSGTGGSETGGGDTGGSDTGTGSSGGSGNDTGGSSSGGTNQGNGSSSGNGNGNGSGNSGGSGTGSSGNSDSGGTGTGGGSSGGGSLGDTLGGVIDAVTSGVYSKKSGNGANAVTTIYAAGTPDNPSVIHFRENFSLPNAVKIVGHAVIVADQGFDFQNRDIQISPNSSLKMYAQGPLSLQGNADVNTLSVPSNFLIYGTGGEGQTIGLGGNAGLSAVIYAPDADFSIKGTSGMFGAVIANTITNNGQGSTNHLFNGLNYDEALQDMTLADDSMYMEDYNIVKANDSFDGDAKLGTYEDFFSKF